MRWWEKPLAFLARMVQKIFHGGHDEGGGDTPAPPVVPVPPSPPAVMRCDAFELSPARWRGHTTWGAIHLPDIAAYLNALVAAGCNAVGLDQFAGTRLPDGLEVDESGQTCYGYWRWHTDDPRWQAWRSEFMRLARERNLVVRVGLSSWEDPREFPDQWFLDNLAWFVSYGAEFAFDGVAICAVNESRPGNAGNDRWLRYFAERWPGVRIYNGDGGRPRSCPAGWVPENHPRSVLDVGAEDGFDVNDAPFETDLWTPAGDPTPEAIEYYRAVIAAGRGLFVLDPRFTAPSISSLGFLRQIWTT